MTIDMSQFYQVFFEESADLLDEMERLLLELDLAEPGKDALNAIFRTAHSIKGGAATFGFNEITETTHILESLLDKLRNDELKLRSEMVDVFLKAVDVIKMQLAGRQFASEVDTQAVADICERLGQLAQEHAAPGAADAATPAAPPAVASKPIPAAASKRKKRAKAVAAPKAVANDALAVELASKPIASAALPVDAASKPSVNDALPVESAPKPSGNDALPVESAPKPSVNEALPVDPTPENLYAILTAEQAVPSAPDAATATAPPVTTRKRKTRAKAAAPTAVVNDRPALDPAQENVYAIGGGAAKAKAPGAAAHPAALAADTSEAYGFFTEIAPVAQTPAPNPERRATDAAAAQAPAGGRRTSDHHDTEATSIRVGVEKVDQLINLVGELVITQAMLAQTASHLDTALYEALRTGLAQLEHNTRDLQESVMSIRMMPISFVFSRFPRVVRDIAGKLDKQVELKTVGEGTELDKGLIEKIADPLNHLVRNSLDHGIESAQKRLAAGKPAVGTITLRAFHQGGNIVIEVSDDGAGLNREKILAKARERGLPVSDAMSDQEVWQLIFEAGFSTADVVTAVSGRGVGMDVVKRNVHAMNGRVEIDSSPGLGTRIAIRLPLTLAILDGMSVSVGEEIFIVPLTFIVESLQPAAKDIKTIAGLGTVVHVRGEYLPVVALHEVLHVQPKVTDFERGIMVIVEAEGCKSAMFVDDLLGQHQVVIKSLESNYRKVPGVSGATIMGDGKVALILDVEALAPRRRRESEREAA